MKPNLDKRFIYAEVGLIVLIVSIIIINGLNHNNGTTTESAITQGTSEWIKNTLEHDYVYVRPKLQRRVIAIRALDPSERPAPFDIWHSADCKGAFLFGCDIRYRHGCAIKDGDHHGSGRN